MRAEDRNAHEVLPHKLFPPLNYEGAVLRRRLIDDILNRPEGVRGIIFQAPAGFGKTTSLQQTMETFKTRGWNTGWLSFDEGDNDPRRFQAHVEVLFAQNNIFDGAASPGVGSLSRLSEWVLDGFLKNKTPTALFFDELQAINEETVNSFFKFILPRLPKHVLIFMGTRSQPDFGLATLLAHHVILLFQAGYLKFSVEEVQDFFIRASNLEISESEVEIINVQTEGWPAALQLFRLALSNPDVRSSLLNINISTPRTLTEYLADNVLSGQSKNIQEFLIKTSVLRRMSGDLCDLVTGLEGSQKILEQLEKSGLFITAMDIDGVWFKYHSLFSTFLKNILERDYRSEVSKIHITAANWFFKEGIYEEALHHALSAGADSFAAEILNEWGSDLIVNGKLVTIERWYDRIPFDQIKSRVDLAIKAAYALLFLRRRDRITLLLDFLKGSNISTIFESKEILRSNLLLAMSKLFDDDVPAAMEILEQPGVFDGEIPVDGFSAFELAAAANLFAFGKIMQADYEGARLSLLLAKNCSTRIGSSWSNGYTLAVEAASLIVQGRMRETSSIFGTLDVLFNNQNGEMQIRTPAAIAASHIWALYEADQITAVCMLWSRYEKEINTALVPDLMAVGHIFAARAFQLKGDLNKVSSILDSLERIAHSSQWERIVDLVNLERIRNSLISDNFSLPKSKSMLDRVSPPSWGDGFLPLSEYVCNLSYISIKLLMRAGDFDDAKKLVSKEILNMQNRPYLLLKIQLLNALIENSRNNPREAKRLLSQALKIAHAGGYERTVLDEGADMLNLITEIYNSTQESDDVSLSGNVSYLDFLKKILSNSKSVAGGHDFGKGSSKLLYLNFSKRQLEILQLLADGKSNKEIAACMFISENTVKFHLKNIFTDLGISNRSKAIKVARDQRLVH